MQVCEALKRQLEQLRTRIREGEDTANRRVLELTQQLQVAAARAEEAEARAAAPSGGAEAERLAAAEQASQPPPTDEWIAELERVLVEVRSEAADNARRAEATEAVRDELEIKV